jgi:hypothetical protein
MDAELGNVVTAHAGEGRQAADPSLHPAVRRAPAA